VGVRAAGTAPAGGEAGGERASAREATADRKEVSLRSKGQRRGSEGRMGIGGGSGGRRRGGHGQTAGILPRSSFRGVCSGRVAESLGRSLCCYWRSLHRRNSCGLVGRRSCGLVGLEKLAYEAQIVDID
jgi:hypothetical protein